MNNFAQLILLLIQLVQGIIERQSRMERARRVLKIRQDPVAEWNRRFKRLPLDPGKETELPSGTTESSESNRSTSDS